MSGEAVGESGGLVQEMTARIPLSGPLFKSDNKTVYLHLAEACRGTAFESTVKTKSFGLHWKRWKWSRSPLAYSARVSPTHQRAEG